MTSTKLVPVCQTQPESTPAQPQTKRAGLKVKTAIRSGDVYLQYPRGGNNSGGG